MPKREFSAIALPYPRYPLEVGSFDLKPGKDVQLPGIVPRLCTTAHIVEVKKPGLNLPADPRAGGFAASSVIIENARPELFLRRDFIAKFVDNGVIHLSHNAKHVDKESGYQISAVNNVLIIKMNEKQYRRFGLIAKKVAQDKETGEKQYKIEVDLRDARIRKSNKFQDKLVRIFRRLDVINKLYFRFASSKSDDLTSETATDMSLEFFRYVIHEYEIDGVRPVPLSGCTKVTQQVRRRWTNYSQRHPNLDLGELDGKTDDLAKLVDAVDWLGYQLLSIDCDKEEIGANYECERLDVACTEVCGPMDLGRMINEAFEDPSLVIRALFLYMDGDKVTVLLQDCATQVVAVCL